MKRIPKQFKRLFWEYRTDKMEVAKDFPIIIDRIAEKGSLKSISWLFKSYPKTLLKEQIQTSRNISFRKSSFLLKVLEL